MIIPASLKKGAFWWIRRDLRIEDNVALYHALQAEREIIPLFIFDTHILDHLDDPEDRRVNFIHDALKKLKADLEQHGSTLLILHGDPVAIFRELDPKSVYTNHDYEPYGTERDTKIKAIVETNGGKFHSYKDIVIFERNEVLKDDGQPYTVFTPYSRKWKALLKPEHCKSYSIIDLSRLKRMPPAEMPELSTIGFREVDYTFPPRTIRQQIIREYSDKRDFPAVEGTSKLSVHLRFGTVSIRRLVSVALKSNETWLNELIWREFYHMILYHFPQASQKAFKPAYDRILWNNNPDEFKAWCEGRTGYPMVDAGMRELNATGFMHNRSRMIAASFLTKHLLIDWRWGEAYFAKKLLDFDLAANNGGWQWAAGSGCDAAPYFRVFNPELQAAKFDPDQSYVRHWIPELGTPSYPSPIVNHQTARDRAIRTYQEALQPE
ncbi:MAG: deoxyribodipyrimidine photo-lyase [Bacteroidetes bacterium]|nr:deoxyribodipyrimidine photo-lyase [Bacteroidota bacterium]